jgi:hypothetical protein
MTTATGQYAINFGTPLADQNPWVDAAWTKRSGGTDKIASGLLRPNTTAFYSYTGAAYSGSSITIGVEVNAAATDDEVVGYITDSSGNGFGIQIAPTIVVVTVLTAWVVTDSVGTASITLGTNDLFTFQVTKGTPNTVAVTRNGSTLTLSTSTYSLSLPNPLEGGLCPKAENVGLSAIKSFAIVSGLSTGSTATATPGVGAVTLSGRAPTANAFTNVRIRDVLINEAGSPVANQTGIHLVVWYSGFPIGAPDLSYSNMTTDPTGTTSWSLATGTLMYNQRIFYVAHDGHSSLSVYTCAQMQPTYT